MQYLQKLALALVAALAVSAPASALDMMVWDAGLQTKLAYAQSSTPEGGRSAGKTVLRGQIVQGASGPVVVLFSLSEAEKAGRALAGLKGRYEGELKGERLTLKLTGGVQSLEKFLEGYGFELELKPVAAGEGALPAAPQSQPFGPELQSVPERQADNNRGKNEVSVEAAPQRTGSQRTDAPRIGPLQPATLDEPQDNADGSGNEDFLRGGQ